jgi:HAE1 family hydrophobic/amphiphilic exporter-1
MKTIKTEFFPTMDNGIISASVELPVGTRQEITKLTAEEITDELRSAYPEIKSINHTFGQAPEDDLIESMNENGSYIVNYRIALKDVADRERGIVEITDGMREILDTHTELVDFTVNTGMAGEMGGETSVDIDVYGYDFKVSDALAAQISERLKALPECSQVTVSRGAYIPEIQFDLDREKLALHGLDVTTVSGYIRNRVTGSVASYFREESEEYDIRVRYAPEYRQSLDAIENTVVYNRYGEGVRIRDLGRVFEELTPPTIERKDRERVVTISAVAANGFALSDLVAATRTVLADTEVPAGVSCEISGSYEDQQETFGDLVTLMLLILILIYIVMAAQFESFTDPFIIMFSIPFALTGVFIGLATTGTPLGVMAMIGVMILLGIVVKNGIVLIDYIKLCRERGMGIIQAVVEAGKSRLRPVLMTTLTTVIGMVPMALGLGEGSEMWKSMGVTVAWGLSVSTLITLVLIPVLYCVFAGGGVRRKRKALVVENRLNVTE